jgi:hypothetical protein
MEFRGDETFADKERPFIDQASDIVEALVNLTYLICEEADHPERVRQYAGMSEERLRGMIDLLSSQKSEN